MKTIYISFQNNYDPDSFTIRKIPFKELYGDFSFKIFEESQNILTGDNQQIIEHLSNSSDLIVDMYKAKNGKIYFLICVDKMLIIIERNDLRLLEKSFNPRKVLKIYFFKNVEKEFIKYINIQYNQSNKKFNIFDRVDFCSIIFNIDSMPKNEFWKVIKKSMLMYLFTKSYAKTLKNRIDEYLQNAQTLDYTNLQEIDKNSYLLLDTIYSVESTIKLAYYIKTQNLFVIKTYNYVNDESKCLQKREIDNLSNISHPLLPRFFGLTNYENKKSLAIEYINGNTLAYCIKKKKITQDNDKFDILMQVMVAIEYLHSKNYVYRDLKPSNVMIDQNKMAVLIDFDRMITGDGTECSRSLQNPYTAPEVQNGKYSFKSDVYSFGLLIYYVLTSFVPSENIDNFDDIPKEYSEVRDICLRCTKKNIDDRPCFADLFCDFYLFCKKHNFIRGIKKAIQYFLFAAEYQND